MHTDDHPVDVRVPPRSGEFCCKPTLLLAARVAVHVEIAAVLVGHVVVVQADHPHRAGGERVPQPADLRAGPRIRDREVRLVGAVTDWPVAQFVLVITRRRHPWPVTGRPGVVLEPVRPGPDPVVREVGVAQIAVDQIEQRRDAFDRDRGVAGRGRTDVVADVPAVGQAVQVRCGLVAETGKSQRLSSGRRGSHGAQLRRRPVVHRGVDVVGVRSQVGQVRVVDTNLGVGLGIPVGPGFGRHGPAESAGRCAQHDSRVADGLGCVPGHHHLGAGVLPELQMQTAHRRRAGPVGLVPNPGTARMRPHQRCAATDAGAESERRRARGQQPAAADAGRAAQAEW